MAKQPPSLQQIENFFEKLSLDEQLQLLAAFKTVINDKKIKATQDLEKIKGAKIDE